MTNDISAILQRIRLRNMRTNAMATENIQIVCFFIAAEDALSPSLLNHDNLQELPSLATDVFRSPWMNGSMEIHEESRSLGDFLEPRILEKRRHLASMGR
jgi:hypothetical protein